VSAGWLSAVDVAQTSERNYVPPEVESVRPAEGWTPERFARDQIRGLVRQIFRGNVARPMRQVVFSAGDPESDVDNICRRVGEALAQERERDVAVVGRWARLVTEWRCEGPEEAGARHRGPSLKHIARRIGQNCWLAPAENYFSAQALQLHLAMIRKEFEYSIVAGPPASESSEALALAQFADGLVLVLSAQNTRRAGARRIKQAVDDAQVRLLGVVLADREFPIPEALYRRL
jgi:ATPases involved in chromosome partitioning